MSNSPIATVSATCDCPDDLDRLCTQLLDKLGDTPDLIIGSYSSLCDVTHLTSRMPEHFPSAAIMGASTCRGAMTADGLTQFGQPSVSLWGLTDEEGDYGVGHAHYQDSIEEAASSALEAAIKDARREGELPDLVWIHSSPGHEEELVCLLYTSPSPRDS